MFGQEVGYVKLLSEQSETVSFKQLWAVSLPRSHDTFGLTALSTKILAVQMPNLRNSDKCITDIFLPFNCPEVQDFLGHNNTTACWLQPYSNRFVFE